jgi:calcium-dependent protein kinase
VFTPLELSRDPTKRPTAKEALKHPWLKGDVSERSTGKQIDLSVVQRIQRFAQNNQFKRSVLQLIAEELLSRPGVVCPASAAKSAGGPGGLEEHPVPEGAELEVEEADPKQLASMAEDNGPIIKCPNSSAMQEIYEKLNFTGDVIDREQAASAMAAMGYKLKSSEVSTGEASRAGCRAQMWGADSSAGNAKVLYTS